MSYWDGSQWAPEPAAPVAAPSRTRVVAGHTFGALMKAGIMAALVGGMAAGTVFAKGGGTSSVPWIALASVNGTSAATVQPNLGSTVNFNAGYPSTTKNPWVSLTCTQNGAVVYGEGGHPWDTFSLGGASSVWLSTGGSASCTAELGDLYWKGGHEYYTYLATTSFAAGG